MMDSTIAVFSIVAITFFCAAFCVYAVYRQRQRAKAAREAPTSLADTFDAVNPILVRFSVFHDHPLTQLSAFQAVAGDAKCNVCGRLDEPIAYTCNVCHQFDECKACIEGGSAAGPSALPRPPPPLPALPPIEVVTWASARAAGPAAQPPGDEAPEATEAEERGPVGGAARMFECAICQQTCHSPVTVLCGAHNCCFACLRAHIAAKLAADQEPRCPVCRGPCQASADRLVINVDSAYLSPDLRRRSAIRSTLTYLPPPCSPALHPTVAGGIEALRAALPASRNN